MSTDLYRAFWRWHFYAGVLVLPFLAWLAVTGGLYLFKPEIERAVYGGWVTLPAPATPMAISRLIAETERQTGGKVTQVELPGTPRETWRMRVEVGGAARTAFVDPGSGAVLGTVAAGGIMKNVRDLHSLVITGPVGNALIEIAAGWAIVLVVTGLVLWWPRGANRAIALRGPTRSRRFWRDLHATTGFLAGGIVLFLAVTGMPWSVVWGAQVQRLVTAHGLGRPKAPGPQPWELENGAGHGGHGSAAAQKDALPWALQAGPRPMASGTADIGVDRALRLATGRGLTAPLTITLPAASGQPYGFSKVAARAEDGRAIYVEPSSGRVLQDAGYAGFGRGAQLIEWGIATHQGQEYGPANRWIMLAGCLALLILCVSAPILWWKRRTGDKLTLPPAPRAGARTGAAAATAAVLGVIYPLTGATMALVWLFDRLVRRQEGASGAG
ncbi:PepSY domain-containing protein [Sphingomonas rosea]|uniref:PepSY domain-containing protein n=1 Tax=Sphingomonas rosea TaxID=335605 RepID=A0ABP7TNP1_9SPHN